MNNKSTFPKLCLKISDPWEIGEAVNWKAFNCEALTRHGERLLVRLDAPFSYEGNRCEYLVASPRHEGESLDQLPLGKSVFCGMSQVSCEIAKSEDPFDISNWRGGIALIGELSPA